MIGAKVSLSDFKTECLEVLRLVSERGESVEVTDHGKVVAVISPPSEAKASMRDFAGSLKGTVTYSPGWDAPLGVEEWEAGR